MHSWPWTVAYAVALVAPALQLLLRAFDRPHPLALPSIGWCIAMLFTFAGIIASALASPYRGSAVLWSAPLLAGLATFFVVFDWIHAYPSEVAQRRRQLHTGAGVFFAAIACASVGLWLAHLPGFGSGNIFAARNPFPLGHSNYTAGLGLLMLPCFVALAMRAARASRIAWSIAALLAVMMLLTSGSRGGFLGLAALVLVHVKAIARTLRISLPVVFLGGTVALAVFVYWNPRTRAALAGDDLKISDVQRAAMVQAGWHMGVDRPFLGWGPGTTPLVYPRYRAMLEGGTENVLQLHSLPIQVWAELGGVNALAGIALLILAVRAARDVEGARGTLFALSGYLVFSVTDWQLDVPVFADAIAAALALVAPPAALFPGEAKIYPLVTLGGRAFSVRWREDYAALRRLLGFMMLLAFTVLGIFGRRDPAPLLNTRALSLATDVTKNNEAAALLRQSLKLNPDQEIAHFNLGWLLVVSEPTAAETHFLAAARLVPDKGGVYFGLGLARLNQGRRADAERAFALECLNDPAFLVSPWWQSPGVRETRTNSLARLLQFYSLLLDALPVKSPLRSEAHYARELAVWLATGAPVSAANNPARTAYFEKKPAPPPFEKSSIVAYRRERTGYPVLMRNLDLPVPTDVFDVQENSLATGEYRFLFPAKGWLASPLLPALLLESDSRQK
ncbi:MAG: O-antigen ligase family protein [Opitutaceae bacterium]